MNKHNILSLAVLILIQLSFTACIVILMFKTSAYVDLWPLDKILVETMTLILMIMITSWIIHKGLASAVFSSVLLAILVILIPVLKYPNDSYLYGPWDSTAHYSFTEWVIVHGRIANNHELYYSDQYGAHPGNALLPAITRIITGLLSTSMSMYIVLSVTYIVYVLMILSLVKRLVNIDIDNVIKYILIMTVILMLNFPPYYGGVELAYAFVGILLYLYLSVILGISSIKPSIVASLIAFLGLLSTHYGTAIILSFYVIILASVLLMLTNLSKISEAKSLRSLLFMVLGSILIFMAYELYVDTYLSSSTIQSAIQILINLYINELELATRAMELHPGLSELDLIKYLLSQYSKQVFISLGMIIYIVYWLRTYGFKRAMYNRNYMNTLLFTAFVASLPAFIVGWGGVGSILAGFRALPLIQFLFATSTLYVISLKNNNRLLPSRSMRVLAIFALGIIAILGFISNYGLPLGPRIQSYEGDVYSHPAWGQGAIPQYAYHPIRYLSDFLPSDSNYEFLCVQPYTMFGLCDLLWNKPKVPIHGFITPKATTSVEMIKLLSAYKDVVVPIPLGNVLPGPIGYTSLYLEPYYNLLDDGFQIYSNGFYVLFVR